MLSTIAFIFVLSVLVIVHEFGHFIVAKMMKVKVEVFSVGFGKKLFSVKRGETEYRISAIPLGGFVKMLGDEPEGGKVPLEVNGFLAQPISKRAAIVAAGPLFNYVFAFIIFAIVFCIGFSVPTTKIGEVKDDFPAQQAGVITGDRILSVNGVKVSTWESLSSLIHGKIDAREMTLELERDSDTIFLTLVPKVIEEKNIFGDTIKIGLIGILPSQEVMLKRFGVKDAITRSASQVWQITTVTYRALFRIITGKMSARASLTGPIGIFKITGEAAKYGFISLLQMMALLSISLAIINLFPIPVLDGGHLFFMIIEKIKGTPVSIKTQEIGTRIGMTMLIALMAFTFYNDFVQYDLLGKLFKIFRK